MIPVSQAHLQVAVCTHPGLRRKDNEDRYAVSAYILSEHQPIPAVLAIVADGIGGHRAGEVAAEMAVETISTLAANSDASQPVQILQNALYTASQSIYNRAESDPTLHGMGTTCACAWIISDRLYTSAVGDSRIYLTRGNAIHQLSTDHTWLQEVIDAGTYTPEQARGHPNRHVIRRFLGSREPPSPDTRLRMNHGESDAQAEANQGLQLYPNDQILLCTDGLTDLVNPNEILSRLRNQHGQAAADSLVELANQRGGHDNITVLLLQMPPGETPRPNTTRRRNFVLTCLAVGILALAGVFLSIGNWLFDWEIFGSGSDRATQTLAAPLEFPGPGLTGSASSEAPLDAPTQLPPVKTVEPGSTIVPGHTVQPATLTPWPTNTP